GDGDATAALKGGPNALTDSPIYRRTFVAREAELRQLQTAFDNALSGNGSLTMVVGEPGIGKTAICEQLTTYVSLRGGRTLLGHCYEEGSLSMPYLAFVEAMRTYVLERSPEALKDELGAGAADVARIVSEIRDKVQIEMRPSGDPEDDRWRLLQSVTSFLRNASSTQPMLVVLEDLHWSDKGTLDLLVHLARNLAGARLLIIGTYRDVEVDRAHPLSSVLAELRRASSFGRVTLRGLNIDEVLRMIKAITGQDAPWGLAEAMYKQAEGNPLFIQEALRYIVEEGMMTRQDGRWQSGDALAMSIPEGLRDVIGKRLSRLSPECNRLLTVAAVIGRDFDLGILSRMVNTDEESLLTSLEEAVRVGVLEERSQVGGVHYRFTHAFFRQTLYEETGAARRIRLHQQVGKALEEGYKARLTEHAAELAEHFSHSSDPSDLGKAVSYGETAAQKAMSVFDYGEAARLLERAIDVQEVLDPDDKAKHCDLLLVLAEALMPAGEPLRVYESVAEAAFSLAEALSDRARTSRACRIALVALRRYGAGTIYGTPAFGLWAGRADRYAEPGTIDRVYADEALAVIMTAAGRWAESWSGRMRALETARQLDDPEALFYAVRGVLNGDAAAQHKKARLELAEEFSKRANEGVTARTLGLVLTTSGNEFLASGDREGAERVWRQMDELATRTQDSYIRLQSLVVEGLLHKVDGHLEDAVAIGERLVVWSEELGSPIMGRQFATAVMVQPLLLLGRGEEALSLLPMAGQLAGAQERWGVRLNRAFFLAHLGRRAEANAALDAIITELGLTQLLDDAPSGTLVGLLETALLSGNAEIAGILESRLDGLGSMISLGQLTSFARVLGAAAALLGDREKAKDYYQQALEVCAKVRFRPEAALTHLQLAELLLQGASEPGASRKEEADVIRKEAMEHLDFAIAEFQAMKMQPSLERALRHKGLLKA
ncbi:MAG: hypothetical protein EXR50_05850, partial [Dehalococcoidia bacterium]|nr:hypothetical protein [Dehalococcoidia bacterium]